MNAIRITNSSHTTTSVPNEFIDQYMPRSNGEYVKVYLFLLRMASSGQAPTLTELAHSLIITEEDAINAMYYWQQQQLLKLTLNAHNQIQYIELLPMTVSSDVTEASYEFTSYPGITQLLSSKPAVTKSMQIETQPVTSIVPPAPAKQQHSPVELESFFSSTDLSNIVYEAETLLEHDLSVNDINTLYYFYDQLHFPAGLIEYLIEYCAEIKMTSMRYLEKVALNWHKNNLHTPEAAKEYVKSHNALNSKVAKAFGIYGRLLVNAEVTYVTRWANDYGFDDSIIIEACTRTIANTHSPSFPYADKILTSWKKAQVHKLSDIAKLDETHTKTKPTTKHTVSKTVSNGFHNFEQRDYDYDDMTKKYVAQLNHSSQSIESR